MAVLSLAAAALVLLSSTARADFGFVPGSLSIRALDTAGEPYNRAGGHPDRVEVILAFNEEGGAVEENPREVDIEFPPGFAGDGRAVPTCPRRVFDGGFVSEEKCPPESQVGIAFLTVVGTGGEADLPIYNVEPAPDELAVLGFPLVGKTPLLMRIRPSDFGVTIEQRDLVQAIPLSESRVVLWGFPGDHQEGTAIPRRPFITLPTRCDRPLGVTVRARSWQRPDREVTAAADTGTPLAGCEALPFAPSLSFNLANPSADSATGATLDLAMPQPAAPEDPSPASIESSDVELPDGISISPGAASSLTLCSDEEFGLGSQQPVRCPASSRIGAAELDAPQLRAAVAGRVFLGEQQAGQRFRLLIAGKGAGVDAKLAGELRIDPVSGGIAVSLDRLPDFSFDLLRLRFDDGPTALLTTPLACGALSASGTFTDRSGRVVGAADTVSVARAPGGGPCPDKPPFSPDFDGGTDRVRAGRTASLSLTLRRRDGEQLTDRFAVSLPSGLSARAGSLSVCTAERAVAATCPAESRIGSAIAEIGPGANPLILRGDTFLTGPYRRAPFGMALGLRASAGPFDLGQLVVRGALRIDPSSGRLTVETDRLPRSVQGLAVRFRTIGLDIDRPGFIRLPTSCEKASIDAEARSVEDAVARISSPFRVRGCDSLSFAPRLSLRLTGSRRAREAGKPGMRIAIRSRGGDASLRSVDIALPAALRQDPTALRSICARQAALEGRCPEASRVGRASGRTPLFDESLAGSIHIVQPADTGPPELWTDLDAEGARVLIRGDVLSRRGRLHARLAALPDVPLSSFVLRLDGGSHGLLSLRAGACAGDRVRAAFEGHNRAYLIRRTRVADRRCPPPPNASRPGSESHG